MAIWDYASQTNDALLELMRASACTFCGGGLRRFEPVIKKEPWGDSKEWRVRVCQTCGWWKITSISHLDEGSLYRGFRRAAAGSLRQLDLRDLSTPVSEIRDYLMGRYEARHEINPTLFEKTVESVFKDLGYTVIVTAGSGDDGIDMLLYGLDGGVVGIQVKRYVNSIEVAQIRELLGALVVNKLTRGLFVTASKFQSGAPRTVQLGAASGYTIELVDGEAFYQALKLVQRATFDEHDVQKLIERAVFTNMSDTGTIHTGVAALYNPNLLKNLPGPGGPQDEWP